MPLQLTPGQAVTLHGWFSPSLTLRWGDVVERDALTFRACRAANLSLRQLHTLQPSVAEWVRHGGVTLAQAVEMFDVWDVKPLADFKADLADVLGMRWSAETMRRLHIGYEDLLTIGLSPETMRMFGYSMLGWINLGFRQEHLRLFTDAQIIVLFAVTRQAAERSFIQAPPN